MNAQLVNLQTNDIVTIHKQPFHIGRAISYVDYCITDPAVSRMHCTLCRRDGLWYVADRGSTNHTYINGLMLKLNTDYRLNHGDELMLARVRFRFEEVL